MCLSRSRAPSPSAQQVVTAAPPIIAAPDNAEAIQAADIEARLRRRRAGAAANILTSPTGIPSPQSVTPTLGGVAR